MKVKVIYEIQIEEELDIETDLILEKGEVLTVYRMDFHTLVNSDEIQNIEIPTNKYVEDSFYVVEIEIL